MVVDYEALLSDKKKVSKAVKKEEDKFDEINEFLSKSNRISVELKKKISSVCSGQTLINCAVENNYDVLLALSKIILKNNFTPVVILTSTNYKSFTKLLEEAKLNYKDIIIIDTVSKNIIDISNTENVYFIDSLSNLTQIEINLFKLMKAKENVLFLFDSLDVLELYHTNKIISKYIYSLTKLLYKYSSNGYYILNKKELVPVIGQFFDNIVELEKVEG